ncbi:hypothetical protein DYB25_007661, partial [Aphanomyces astaci]
MDLFKPKKNPEKLAKHLREAMENPSAPVKPDKSGKGQDESSPQKCSQLAALLIADNALPRLVLNLAGLPFEARKHVAQIYNNFIRRDLSGFVTYIERQPQIMSTLVRGYENADIALNCGTMLREALARQVLYSDDLWKFFDTYVHLPNFDVGSDAFASFKDLLTRHKGLVSVFFDTHFDQVFEQYNRLLSSENYVTRRQSLKLLGEILLDRSNFDIMMRYICKRDNLKMMMNLLRDTSANIQFEAFHVFKVFVANPKKPNEVTQILLNNKDKLIAYLEKFQNDKDDSQFVEEKALLIRTLGTLELAAEDPPNGKPMTTSTTLLRGVACTYETFPCYHVLSLLVNNEDGIPIFQPTLVENEVYRFLRALHILPTVPKQATTTSISQAHLVGQYINDGVSTAGMSMDVMAYFGKQAAVQHQLTLDGWWAMNLSKHIDKDEEGVYAVVQGLKDDAGGMRVVLFAWLKEESFEPMFLRERATYVLRFLTTLTSNVVGCLTERDVVQAKLALCAGEAGCVGSASKKYSVSFSIQTAKVVEEKVECRAKYTAGWGEAFETATLIPSQGEVSLVVVKSDRSIATKCNHRQMKSHEDFAAWLKERLNTHVVTLDCPVPRNWMASALKVHGLFPEEAVNGVTPGMIEDAVVVEAEGKVISELTMMRKRCEENAAIVFHVKLEGSAQEMAANEALKKDLAMLKGWYLAFGRWPPGNLLNYGDRIHAYVNTEYVNVLSQSQAPKDLWWSSRLWSVFVGRSQRLSFPYQSDDATAVQTLQNVLELATRWHRDWCRMLHMATTDMEMFRFLVAQERAEKMKKMDTNALIKNHKSEIIHDAFRSMVEDKNGSQSSRLELVVCRSHQDKIWYEEQCVQDKAELVRLYECTEHAPKPKGSITLPVHSKLVFVCRVDDMTVLVYTRAGTATTETHVDAYKKSNFSKPVLVRTFPKEALHCDFDAGHRILVILHSNTVVDVYAFNESYKVLERVSSFDLALLRLESPYSCLIAFGGDNNGVTVVDHRGYMQSYFIRSRQFSKLVDHLVVVNNTKVVKVQGGAIVLLLTELSGATEHLYPVRVQTLLTADNTMLPETVVELPTAMNWPDCSVQCVGSTLVCFDPLSTKVQTWELDIVTGKTAWQLQGSQSARGGDNPLEAHPLWSLFHLFEKFPVCSLVSTASPESRLVSGNLHLHVPGLANHPAISNLLVSVMFKLRGLNKDLSSLNLPRDLHCHGTSAVPWSGSSVVVSKWVLELMGFVPVQICRARENQLVVLSNGEDADNMQAATATEAHEVAKSIWFGPISSVLQRWTGPVVVLTSMGKQSTGKSYYLNHLTGSSFAISGARCTDGVWLTARLMGSCLLVVLDFEGLGSFERSAQEDTFLSVLNAAVSRLTVFRIEMRFDKDIDAMFSKFQQGVSLLKGDPRLFQGKLYLNAKDVNPNDQNTVIFEFQSKLEAILNENRAENFVTSMYGGNVEITCCPPLGNVGYHEALQEGLELLVKARESVSYSSGLDFYDCLTMVLSKISLLDWTCMEDNLKERLAMEVRGHVRSALRYGKLAHCSLVDGDAASYVDKWLTLLSDADMLQALPADDVMDFRLDLNLKAEELLGEAKAVMMHFLKDFLEHIDEPRSPSVEGQFDAVWTFLLWRRERRVRLWVASLPSVGREEMDDLDVCAVKLKQLLRRCQHTCTECKLGCFECFLHDASVPHDCGTSHKCVGQCSHCSLLGDAEACSYVAGHAGLCNCGLKAHTCHETCALAGAANCDQMCSLEVGHSLAHSCGVILHCCGQPCGAPNCRGQCTLPFENAHDVHQCGMNRCQQRCVMPDCGNTCADPDHFHADHEKHLCGQDHRCTFDCTEDGICEIKVHLEKATETFAGQRGTFDFCRQEMNGSKRKCSEMITASATSHTDTTSHRCDSAIHYCDVRCPCCQYFCDKAYGHTDLHHTSHGNMKDTYFVSDTEAVDIQDRKYTAGEQGVAEMCPFFCSKMGRGHVHFMPCLHSANSCVYTSTDGRQHCTLQLQPHPTKPMDEVLHETYWKTLGWEDPVSSAAEKAAFKLCPYKCDASDHTADAPSYCILDAWHDVMDKHDPRGQQPGHT